MLHKCWAFGWDPAGSLQIRLALVHSRWLFLIILVPAWVPPPPRSTPWLPEAAPLPPHVSLHRFTLLVSLFLPYSQLNPYCQQSAGPRVASVHICWKSDKQARKAAGTWGPCYLATQLPTFRLWAELVVPWVLLLRTLEHVLVLSSLCRDALGSSFSSVERWLYAETDGKTDRWLRVMQGRFLGAHSL